MRKHTETNDVFPEFEYPPILYVSVEGLGLFQPSSRVTLDPILRVLPQFPRFTMASSFLRSGDGELHDQVTILSGLLTNSLRRSPSHTTEAV